MTDDNIIRPIFSVGISTFGLTDIDNEPLVEYSKKTTHRNKVKEKKDILSNPIFADLNKFIEDRMNDYYAGIYKEEPSRIKLTEAWSNVGTDELITMPHSHPSFVSAVYYPHATEGDIVFFNPAYSVIASTCARSSNKVTSYNSEFFSFPSRTGNLIVFPSKLLHMAQCSGNERISIAYNGSPILQEPTLPPSNTKKSYLKIKKN